MKTMQRKEVEDVQGFILSVVGIGVILAVGLIVLAQLQNNIAGQNVGANCGLNSTLGTGGQINYTNCGLAYNSTGAIVTQMATIPNWIGILITVALAFIVLGYFYNR